MSTNYTFKYDLYGLYDRPFEGCEAKVTVELPDNYAEIAPKSNEVKLVDIAPTDETAGWLTSTYFTNLEAFTADLRAEFINHNWLYDMVIENLVDNIPEDQLDDWTAGIDSHPTWVEIGESVEMTSLEDLLP